MEESSSWPDGARVTPRGRQERCCALDAMWVGTVARKVNWIVDADICGFFDSIDHGMLMQCVERRIADPRVLRLLRKWLRAGVSEAGTWSKTTVGTLQGSVISPLLANIFLHYVCDLWVKEWRKHAGTGEVIVVRYADDFVVGFQFQQSAERFLHELRARLAEFRLELHPEKTRLIEFGRFAMANRAKKSQGKPATFNFLGFTHRCAKRWKDGRFTVIRSTIAKRMGAKLQQTGNALMERRSQPLAEQGKWLASVVRGW